jgi:hypothetical protein
VGIKTKPAREQDEGPGGAGKNLPALPETDTAKLPASYEHAKQALAAFETVDEAREWASKAEAIAAYAKMAKDKSLFNYARRIQLRARRRAGELRKEIPAEERKGAGRPRKLEVGTGPQNSEAAGQVAKKPVSARAKADKDAGFSERQAKDNVDLTQKVKANHTAARRPNTKELVGDRRRDCTAHGGERVRDGRGEPGCGSEQQPACSPAARPHGAGR